MGTSESDPATARRWRRTSFCRLAGSTEFASDDWTLEDHAGQHLGRIYKQTGGPNDRRWAWFAQVDQEGRPRNGGTGVADTGREAREAVEALVPEGLHFTRWTK